jgi:hypothetical protein
VFQILWKAGYSGWQGLQIIFSIKKVFLFRNFQHVQRQANNLQAHLNIKPINQFKKVVHLQKNPTFFKRSQNRTSTFKCQTNKPIG